MTQIRKITVGRLILAGVMVAIGCLHFTHVQLFASIVPAYLPAPELLVYISGIFEIGLGLGLLFERTRVLAAWGLMALYLAVFPANVNMALHPDLPLAGVDANIPEIALWLRLPLQFALLYWAYLYTRPHAQPPSPLVQAHGQGVGH